MVLGMLEACADMDPATVCPLPVEEQPGGGDPVACDTEDPATYGQCFEDCNDLDESTVCPLGAEGFSAESILILLNSCANGDPICPLGGDNPAAEALLCFAPADLGGDGLFGQSCLNDTLAEAGIGTCADVPDGPCWPFEASDGTACVPLVNNPLFGDASGCSPTTSIPLPSP